ncbi:DUF3267 domain-containing protein [Atopobiaceae bacterium 24-176]
MRDLGMTTAESVDLLSDESWLASVARASLAVVVAGVAADVAWASLFPSEPLGIGWFLVVAAAAAVALPVHELVHGAAFKLAGGKDVSVRFGYAQPGMLYTCADGAVLPRRAFMGVLLAPAVVVSAVFAVGGACLSMPLAGFTCLWLHLSGCAGDFAMARRVARSKSPYVRDTAVGFDLVRPAAKEEL